WRRARDPPRLTAPRISPRKIRKEFRVLALRLLSLTRSAPASPPPGPSPGAGSFEPGSSLQVAQGLLARDAVIDGVQVVRDGEVIAAAGEPLEDRASCLRVVRPDGLLGDRIDDRPLLADETPARVRLQVATQVAS